MKQLRDDGDLGKSRLNRRRRNSLGHPNQPSNDKSGRRHRRRYLRSKADLNRGFTGLRVLRSVDCMRVMLPLQAGEQRSLTEPQ